MKDTQTQQQGLSGEELNSNQLANGLFRLGYSVDPDMEQNFCTPPSESSSGTGCNKFHECPIHPDKLKSLPIEQIAEEFPEEFELLERNNCLRSTFHKNREAFKEAELTLGDHIGAVDEKKRGLPQSDAAKILAAHRCPLNGCAIPELQRPELFPPRTDGTSLEKACPFARAGQPAEGGSYRNPLRFLACALTREDFRKHQLDLGVLSIAPISIMPAHAEALANVIYVGKNTAARYQYLSMHPEATDAHDIRDFSESLIRFHSPRLVRHSVSQQEGPDLQVLGHHATLTTLKDLAHRDKLSPLERELGIRYIPAGEFLFLCLMWFWTGEYPPPKPYSLSKPRRVFIERTSDAMGLDRLLISKLVNSPFSKRETKSIYGDIHYHRKRRSKGWYRESDWRDDLCTLGLLSRSERPNCFSLTNRTKALTAWLSDVFRFFLGGHGREFPVLNEERLHCLFRCDYKWIAILWKAIDEMVRGVEADSADSWMSGIEKFLVTFGTCFKRSEYRRVLLSRGFPVYPLVHLTLFAGYTEPLDWLALPLGPPVTIGELHSPEASPVPQAAAFILSRPRSADDMPSLIDNLRSLLLAPAHVDTAGWVEERVRQKLSIVQFGAILASRRHAHKDVARAPYETHEKRSNAILESARVLRSEASSAKGQENEFAGTASERTLRRLLGFMSEALVTGKLAERDGLAVIDLIQDDWKMAPESLAPVFALIRPAWNILKDLDLARGRRLRIDPPRSSSRFRIYAPRFATFYQILEALRNVIQHDKAPHKPIHITISKLNSRTAIRFWNYGPRLFEAGQIGALESSHSKPDYTLGLKGLETITLFGRYTASTASRLNQVHPALNELRACLELTYPSST